jgi:hypothetical protein
MDPEKEARLEAYQQNDVKVVALLGSIAQNDLNEVEAKTRIQKYGKNELTSEPPTPWWKKHFAQRMSYAAEKERRCICSALFFKFCNCFFSIKL